MIAVAEKLVGPLPEPSPAYFRKVNLELTTHCNLRCPECAAGIGINRVLQHHPWEYFEEAAKWLYGTHSVVVMGGEPTAHPKFAEFVPRFRELFGCSELVLWTNGYRVKQYQQLIDETFDAVYVSLYDATNAPWNKRPNTDLVQFVRTAYSDKHATMEAEHTPMDGRGSGEICERGMHGPVTYADGKIYGCCVAVAIDGGVGITPSQNWKDDVLHTSLPCWNCCFSPK